jgi:hypothetical protein
MNDVEVLAYVQSHAPLDLFYLFAPQGTNEVLMKYFDSSGRSWILMEDDDETVDRAVGFLKRSGVPVFDSYPAVQQYEQDTAKRLSSAGVKVNGCRGQSADDPSP